MFVLHKKHAYGPPRPVTKIALLFICRRYSYLPGNTPVDLHGLLRGWLNFLYTELQEENQVRLNEHGRMVDIEGRRDPLRSPRNTLYLQKSTLTSSAAVVVGQFSLLAD
jgi:hypothetical protein